MGDGSNVDWRKESDFHLQCYVGGQKMPYTIARVFLGAQKWYELFHKVEHNQSKCYCRSQDLDDVKQYFLTDVLPFVGK